LGKQVLAQSLFRSNDTNQAIERYFTMLQSSKDNNVSQEQMEILTNAMAVLTSNVTPVTQSTTSTSCQPPEDNYIITTAQALIDSTKNDHGNDDDELYPYDLAYNLGTHYVLTGQHCGIARALLQQAQVHATTINDKSTIQANLAWSTHWKTGNIVEEYPTKSTANAQVATVVQINTQKQPMQLDQNQLETFSPLQHRLYYYNRAISGIKSNKLDVCKESCQALLGTLGANNKKGLELPVAPTRFKDDEHWWKALVTVVEAHMLNHQGKKTEAIQLLDQRLVTLREHQKRQQPHIIFLYGNIFFTLVDISSSSAMTATTTATAAQPEWVEVLRSLEISIQEESYGELLPQCERLLAVDGIPASLRETVTQVQAKACLWLEDYSRAVAICSSSSSRAAAAAAATTTSPPSRPTPCTDRRSTHWRRPLPARTILWESRSWHKVCFVPMTLTKR